MDKLVEFFQRKKKFSLQDSVTGYPAIEREKTVDFYPLPQTEEREILRSLAFSIEKDDWNQIEQQFGDDISLEGFNFSGNCEDYIHSLYPNVPDDILSNKAFLESTLVPKEQVQKDQRYLVVYWRDESISIRMGREMGRIKAGSFPEGRVVPVHVGIVQGDIVVSKFSISGGIVKHKVTVVPSNFGEKYSFHKMK